MYLHLVFENEKDWTKRSNEEDCMYCNPKKTLYENDFIIFIFLFLSFSYLNHLFNKSKQKTPITYLQMKYENLHEVPHGWLKEEKTEKGDIFNEI